MRPLSYRFYEDGVQYDAFAADVRQPTLILQGLRDESVDYRVVEQFAAARPNMHLTLLDDEHQLMASLPRICSRFQRTIRGGASGGRARPRGLEARRASAPA